MDPATLRNALRKLHEELGRAQQVDSESRQLLKQLAGDIERLASGQPAQEASHGPRLKELEARFEADHPALAETLREIFDALAKAGL